MLSARINLLTFLGLLLSASFASATSPNRNCEEKTVKLNAEGGPLENIGIQDQDGLATCFANTASLMLSASLPNHPKVSFLDLALLQSSADSRGTGAALTKSSHLSDQPVAAFEFGFVCTSINEALKRGYACTQESFPVEAGGYINTSDAELIRSFGQFYDDLRASSQDEAEAEKRAIEAYAALKSGRLKAQETCKHDSFLQSPAGQRPVSSKQLEQISANGLSRFMHEILEQLEQQQPNAPVSTGNIRQEKEAFFRFAKTLEVDAQAEAHLTARLSGGTLPENSAFNFPSKLSEPIKSTLTQTILPAIFSNSKFLDAVRNPRTKVTPLDVLNSSEVDQAFDELIKRLDLPLSWKPILKVNFLGGNEFSYLADFAAVVDVKRCVDSTTENLLYTYSPEDMVCTHSTPITQEGLNDAGQLATLLPEAYVDMELIDRFFALHPDGTSKGVKPDDFYRQGLSNGECSGGNRQNPPLGAIPLPSGIQCASKGFPSGSLKQSHYYSHRNGQKLPEMRRLFAREVSQAVDVNDLSRGRPLALDLCGQVLSDLKFDGANAVGGCRSKTTGLHNRHAVTLTGYRNIKDENGQCQRQYLIQNSWGEESCRTLGQQYCETPDGGGTWLPEDALIKNVYRISTLK